MTVTSGEFRQQVAQLVSRIDSLSDRRVVLFGGKGGVGKTTLASIAALRLAESRDVVLFSTDPASNLRDVFPEGAIPNLRIESVDGEALYREFLDQNEQWILEVGDRGTYLDREELQRFFELALPGIDELMSWRQIGALARSTDATIVVDTAPTGHTLRMLSSSNHFRQFARALETMQEKHRDIVQQLTRRRLRDGIDARLEEFSSDFRSTADLLRDRERSSFVAVTLAEEWVVEQTIRLAREVEHEGISVPFVVLNQASHDCDCEACRGRAARETAAREKFAPREVVSAPTACASLDSVAALRDYVTGTLRGAGAGRPPVRVAGVPPVRMAAAPRMAGIPRPPLSLGDRKLIFFCGKGGVGKTTTATSVALQLSASRDVTLLSVDPAHSVRDVFDHEKPPATLRVETIDTRRDWEALRCRLGDEIQRAINALTPSGLTLQHDSEVMKELLDMAPPGADEIFALMRIADLLDEKRTVVIDTAPTGHFLRLIDLPRTAGEWVREFMRLLLKYRELIPAGSLGEELLKASKALHRIESALQSEEASAVVVMRAEPVIAAETARLISALEERNIRIDALVVNYLTPDSDCSCDAIRRDEESRVLESFPRPVVPIERLSEPPVTLDALRRLVPMSQTVR